MQLFHVADLIQSRRSRCRIAPRHARSDADSITPEPPLADYLAPASGGPGDLNHVPQERRWPRYHFLPHFLGVHYNNPGAKMKPLGLCFILLPQFGDRRQILQRGDVAVYVAFCG